MKRTESRKSLVSLLFAPELRAWRGRMALPVVFWGYGIATSTVLAILHATALDAGQLGVQQALILISSAYTVCILVVIWRCARNTGPFWGTLARWLTVAWGVERRICSFVPPA